MGKEDLAIKTSSNYANMLNGMFQRLSVQNTDAQPMFLPFLVSGNLKIPAAMPFMGFSPFYGSGNDSLMRMMSTFFSNISKKIDEITVSFSDLTQKPTATENSGAKTPQITQTPPAKKTNALKMLTDDEFAATIEAAKEINCDPNELIAIMYNESGLKPAKANQAGSGNIGLIQFGKAAAKDLGTTQTEIAKMNYKEQLKYVVKYYKLVKSRLNIPQGQKIDGATLYAMTFRPGYAKNEVLAQKGENAYDKFGNNMLDIDNDYKITKKDLTYHVNKQKKALGLTA